MTVTREDVQAIIREAVAEAWDRQVEATKAEFGTSAVPAPAPPAPLNPEVRTALSNGDDEALGAAIARAIMAERRQAATAGNLLGGMCRAICAAKTLTDYGSGSQIQRAAQIARDLHKNSAVEKALSLSMVAEGGALVAPEHLPEIIEFLRAASVFRQLNPTTIPLVNGAASISKLTGGSTAYWVGESENITPSQLTTGLVNFSAKKLAALTPVSNDLLRIPSASADMVVEQDLRGSVGMKLDWTCIRGTGTAYSPKGIENLTPSGNKHNITTPVTLATMTTDMGTLLLDLLEADCRMLRPGWLMAPRTFIAMATVRDGNGNYAFRDELMRGTFWTFPFRFTSQIPVNLGGGLNESKIYLADFADVVLAEEMGLELAVSSDAAYYNGSAVVAAFSRDETVIRAILKMDMNVRHEESLAMLEQVTWT